MSLRQATCLTPKQLDANRRNAQQSTGPRSDAGKQCVRMNALKHGCDAAPENEAAVMRALGEDPERFAALKRELATAYGPGDALWNHQLEDLAILYSRRGRIERLQSSLMREALEKVEERQRGFARALAGVTFDPPQCQAVAFDLPQPTHPNVRLRLLISLWGVILEQVRRRVFTLFQQRRIESYYQGVLGWRPKQICHLLGLFLNWADFQQKHGETGLKEYVKETFGGEAAIEARYQELERLLQEEIAAVEAAFAEDMAAQERKDAIERDTCLAPDGKTWEMLLRQESALDRAIDRKVRILLTMRKEHERLTRGSSRTAPELPEASPPEEESNDREAEELSKLVGLESAAQKVAPNFSSADADASLRTEQAPKVSVTEPEVGTESPIDQNAAETPKSPEQSQNVIENKESAEEEVTA